MSKIYQNIFQNETWHSGPINLKIFIYELDSFIYSNWSKAGNWATPNDIWKNSDFIQKFSVRQSFGLDQNQIIAKLYKHHFLQCFPYKLDNFRLDFELLLMFERC